MVRHLSLLNARDEADIAINLLWPDHDIRLRRLAASYLTTGRHHTLHEAWHEAERTVKRLESNPPGSGNA